MWPRGHPVAGCFEEGRDGLGDLRGGLAAGEGALSREGLEDEFVAD